MANLIIKLKRGKSVRYLEWSTICEAPVTWGMRYQEFLDDYECKYGVHGMIGLEERLARVREKGTSSLVDDSLEDTILLNRAGPGETTLTKRELWEKYCVLKRNDYVPERSEGNPLRHPNDNDWEFPKEEELKDG